MLCLYSTLIAQANEAPPTTMRYLALGDSYTIGESVSTAQRWPLQLQRLLHEGGIQLTRPEIIAATGWTTTDLRNAIGDTDPPGPYALVTLLIGVNNQFQGLSQEDYGKELAALIDLSIELTAGQPRRVLVVSIPDWVSA